MIVECILQRNIGCLNREKNNRRISVEKEEKGRNQKRDELDANFKPDCELAGAFDTVATSRRETKIVKWRRSLFLHTTTINIVSHKKHSSHSGKRPENSAKMTSRIFHRLARVATQSSFPATLGRHPKNARTFVQSTFPLFEKKVIQVPTMGDSITEVCRVNLSLSYCLIIFLTFAIICRVPSLSGRFKLGKQ